VRQQYAQQQARPQYTQPQNPVPQQPAYRQAPVPSPQYATPQKKSHAGLIAVIVVLLLAVVGVGAYFFISS
jgi:hypothetical protein